MLDRYVDVLLAALLLSFFLPLLAWYSILAAFELRHAGFNRTGVSGAHLFRRQTADEFNFERAIEAYEELIDSTFAEGRP